MSEQKSHYRLSLEAIAGFEAVNSEAELGQALSRAIARFGYHSYCIAAAASPDRKFSEKVLLVSWPQGWLERYIERNYHQYDPIAAHLRNSLDPFRWKDIPVPDTEMAREVMSSAAEFGLRKGYCIPVQGLSGYQVGISLAGTDVDDAGEACAAVELIGMYAYMRLNHFRRPAQKALTTREREVVSWIAAGKSAWDTGSILNIAEDTVNKHIKSAMRKLDVHTRAQAVAESIRRGEIVL